MLATGGTIASRATAGGAIASAGGSELLSHVAVPAGVEVTSRDVLRLNSFAMTPKDMRAVLDAVHTSLGSAEVCGVVVTHGTDTMEETAFLVDLFLADERPVVFTGAQRGADRSDSDGPANLGDALTVAAGEHARGLGALIVFDGTIYGARGTRKAHTLASGSFAAEDTGPIGGLAEGRAWINCRPWRPKPLNPELFRADEVRVDIVATYPGCDSVALDAVAGAKAHGVVLEATGAGNANPAIRDAVARLTAQGVVVLLSTRVAAGPVVPLYGGGGGGVDLVTAGAIPTGLLRPSQARILLIALLGTGAGRDDIRAALTAPHS